MEVITKTLRLEKIEYYITHLSIVNCVLPVKLTPKEIEVLAWFMSFDGDMAKDRFGTKAKKTVRIAMTLTHQGLSNYMRSLADKKFLLERDGKMEILPILHPNKDKQKYMLTLQNLE